DRRLKVLASARISVSSPYLLAGCAKPRNTTPPEALKHEQTKRPARNRANKKGETGGEIPVTRAVPAPRAQVTGTGGARHREAAVTPFSTPQALTRNLDTSAGPQNFNHVLSRMPSSAWKNKTLYQ